VTATTSATGGSIPDLLRHWAAARPDRVFLWCGEEKLTYREADERTDRVAAGLAELGVAGGEHLAIISPNRPEMLEIYLGAAKTGAIQVPLNIYLKGQFLRDQLIDSAAGTVVADAAGARAVAPLLAEVPGIKTLVLLDDGPGPQVPDRVEVIRYERIRTSAAPLPEVAVTADSAMSIVYTSGTTGAPKGCLLAHGYYVRTGGIADAMAGFTDDDVLITAMPLFHGAARMMVVAGALRRGITAVVEPEFRSTFLTRAAETGATVMFGVASMSRVLLAQPAGEVDRSHRLRLAVGGPADAVLEREVQDRFGFAVSSQIYGQTECACSTFASGAHPAQPGSAGRVAPDLELKLVDDQDNEVPVGEVGEIVFRPHHRNAMFRGYWGRPEDTLHVFRGLWYHSGDYGRLAEDGSLFFVDRKKDYLRRRGENVSSLELESAILAHPKVADVAVHGVPSDMGDDDIKACLVAVAGAALEPQEMFDFFARNVPYFAIPRYVEVLDELPKNAVGRVTKNVLRDRGVGDTTWDFEQLGMVVTRQARR
jgi:crotonobetaine/carnitine-CoA ligase